MLELLDKVAHAALRARGAVSLHVATSNGRVHAYDVRGGGEVGGTFALLHGLGTTATSYAAVIRLLRPAADRILVVDLPAHGRSDSVRGGLDRDKLRAGVREALDALIAPATPATVLGTSLGGALALAYALDRPERVRALVLVSPAGAPLSEEEIAALRARFDLRTRADAHRFLAELLHAPPWYFRAMEAGLARQLGRREIQDLLASLVSDGSFTAKEVATLAPPTTLLWGKSDRVLPRSGLTFYRDALPAGTRIEELDGIGHSPHVERPALLVRRLLDAGT